VPIPVPPKSSLPRRIWLAALILVLVGASTGILLGREPEPLAPVAAAEAPQPAHDPTAAVLKAQAAALIKGDERAWLAAVDPGKPKLRARYSRMFISLRGLGVSQFAYYSYAPVKPRTGAITVRTYVAYCFSRKTCPDYADVQWKGPPRIVQALTFKRVGGRYVITALGKATEPNSMQPTPWENSELFFARGKRVTVAATGGQRKNLKRVLRLAEKAAVVTDRYAALVRNPQPRYRIYLADDKAWTSWYGGVREKWVVGLAVPLNDAGTDTMLRMSQLGDARLLAGTIQHEMGHVVTLSGATARDPAEDRWLSEGIAEYIGWAPEPASASWRRSSLRVAFRGSKRPATIVAKSPGVKASDLVVDAFYGLGHFAANCMAARYGERRLFDFVRLALRQDNTYDHASRVAFGKPFVAVDKACIAWIGKQL
jgi:hypothetical protein